ncbi:MAG TPA: VWA domain-containing protein, partial [Candidatus Ozemobacteraceae bacterium]|nr:VWA domain-containing protein [Candidatus Ozemobacteraceae bacterium]
FDGRVRQTLDATDFQKRFARGEEWERQLRGIDREPETNLGEALEQSTRLVPAGQRGQVVLLSDGRDTAGTWEDAASRLGRSNVPVITMPLTSQAMKRDTAIARLIVPEQCFMGEEIQGRVLLRCRSEQTLDVTVALGATKPERQKVQVVEGLTAHSFSLKPAKVGRQILEVRAESTAAPGSIVTVRALIQVKPLPRALIIESDEVSGRFLRDVLRQEGVDYLSYSPASAPQELLAEIRNYPCLILNNIPKTVFQDKHQIAIREAVREGMGLLMVGGVRSFGLGEYTDTPIEEALPVRMPRVTVNQPLALVLLLDASGSMFNEPWSYLKEAAKEVVRLCRGHVLGIVVFNNYPYWVWPLSQIDDPEKVCYLLDQVGVGGGTIFSLPMAEGYSALKKTAFEKKTVILFSDGIPADFQAAESLLDYFRQERITITTIGAGNNINPMVLETIANETGGQFHSSPDFADLPKLFREEFKRLVGPPIAEADMKPVLKSGAGAVRGFRPDEFPEVSGINVTQLKPRAEELLVTPNGDPLLVQWRFGLGRGMALTTDLLPNWSSRWARWDGFGKLMRQSIKELSEGARDPWQVQVNQTGATVRVDVNYIGDRKRRPVMLHVDRLPGGATSVPFRDGRNGRYTAEFRCLTPGVYPAHISGPDGALPGDLPLPVNESEEWAEGITDFERLRQIAERTGGEFWETAWAEPLHPPVTGAEVRLFSPLWPFFAVCALLLYLVDIFLRKAGIFSITRRSESQLSEESGEDLYRQLAVKFSTLAEEAALKGNEEEAKQFFLRAKAFYLKGQAQREAQLMWERYKRFDRGNP